MLVKTSELSGVQLDWAVCKAEGRFDELDFEAVPPQFRGNMGYSTDWSLGGPIIEREGIAIYLYGDGEWQAVLEKEYEGPTPLVAAMRCFVASRLGEEVEVPDDLA